jgi:predicted HicB family RNase H-like nuclease
MVTRTFRVNPEYDKILNDEAEKHGLSVSALLNQIIRQYVFMTRFTEKVPAITLSYYTLAPARA